MHTFLMYSDGNAPGAILSTLYIYLIIFFL